jgi:hypothetical protein
MIELLNSRTPRLPKLTPAGSLFEAGVLNAGKLT